MPDLLSAYGRICAYLSLYLEAATGNSSVDHFVPKTSAEGWKLAYEWSNYRLCAASVNSKKLDRMDVVDPFKCQKGWFQMEFVAFQVVRAPAAPLEQWATIEATLELLNIAPACRQREEYVDADEKGLVSREYLEQRAPFLASEYFRQKSELRR